MSVRQNLESWSKSYTKHVGIQYEYTKTSCEEGAKDVNNDKVTDTIFF